MSSVDRQSTNSQNAQKSTGPRTPEGKARSSKNAMKHGLTSKDVVLPTENAAEFESSRQFWISSMQPADAAEMALTERATAADWRLKRCVKSETARLSIQVRRAEDAYDLEQFAHADRLGNQLIHDPIVRTRAPHLDPYSVKKLDDYRKVEHKILLREMLTFAQGVDWLIARWERIGATLEREFFWHYPEKFEACRMLGIKIEDSFDDPLVAKIHLSCSALHPYPWPLEDDLQSATLGIEGRPNYALRIELLKDQAITDCDVAMTNLQEIYQGELKRLRELKASKLDPRDALDRRDVVEAAMFDDSKKGTLALRYETARDRELRGALSEFEKKRKGEEKREKQGSTNMTADHVDEPCEPTVDASSETDDVSAFKERTTNTRRTAPPNEPNPAEWLAPIVCTIEQFVTENGVVLDPFMTT